MTAALRQTAAWGWTLVNLVFALTAASQGTATAAILFTLVALVGCPALRGLRDGYAVEVPPWLTGVAFAAAMVMAAAHGVEVKSDDAASDDAASAGSTTPQAASSNASATPDPETTLKAHIPTSALPEMTRAGYPKMYARLGKATFDEGNALAFWAGVAAVDSGSCPDVTAIGVSDSARRGKLVWFVNCANDEQFAISSAQARAAKTRHDAGASASARALAAKVPAAAPKSARWTAFNEVAVVSLCDEVMKRVATSRSSLSLAWRWSLGKDDATGIATIERDFEGGNALGGTISSRYRCTFDVDQRRLTHFWVRELDGWNKII